MKNLVFMRSHYIDEALLLEYSKLLKCQNDDFDCILFIDNHTNFLNIKTNEPVIKLQVKDTVCITFLYTSQIHESMKFPYYTDDSENTDLGNIMWYNSDYPLYIVRRYFSDYDYYWSIEGDVFCNGASYLSFFEKYANVSADLLVQDYMPVKSDDDWYWKFNSDWCYREGTELYRCLFPVVRTSGKALDYLYKKRIEYASKFEHIKTDSNNRWLFCELFVPTELTNNGFTCLNLDEPKIRYQPVYNLNKERIFERPDNRLYHPVK